MNYQAAKKFILAKLDAELSSKLFYHGRHHTLDVLKIVKELCIAERISQEDCLLVETAALFHDSGFTQSYQNHEELGCEIARSVLPQFDYINLDIDKICGMIMATKIPQSPQNHLEEILCDADLDYLGRDDFQSIGHTLFEELKAHNILQDIQSWNKIQVQFLESHHFLTTTNQKRRTPQKQLHLNKLKKIVQGYDKDEV